MQGCLGRIYLKILYRQRKMQDLPNELLYEILGYTSDRETARLVCHRWKDNCPKRARPDYDDLFYEFPTEEYIAEKFKDLKQFYNMGWFWKNLGFVLVGYNMGKHIHKICCMARWKLELVSTLDFIHPPSTPLWNHFINRLRDAGCGRWSYWAFAQMLWMVRSNGAYEQEIKKMVVSGQKILERQEFVRGARRDNGYDPEDFWVN
jgi:F-box domain